MSTGALLAAGDQTAREAERRRRARWWWAPLGLVAATRIVFVVAAYGVNAIVPGHDHGAQRVPALVRPLVAYARFDAGHFIRIASHGYTGLTVNHGAPAYDAAFFPGYPLLGRWVAAAFGSHSELGAAVALTCVAWLGVTVSALLLWRLAYGEAGEQVAGRSVAMWCAGPYAVFLVAPYSEGIFLACALAAWLAARRRSWWSAGSLAAAAALVRVNGLFLVAGLLVMYVVAAEGSGRRPRTDLLALALPVASVVGYWSWLWRRTGDVGAWFHAERLGWDRRIVWPWVALRNSIERLAATDGLAPRCQDVFELVSAAVFVAGVVALLRRRRWPEATYVGLTAASLLTGAYYVSLPRSLLLCFPLVIVAAEKSLTPRARQLTPVITTVAVALLAFNSFTFLTDQWTG